jgi:hypothetical protein
MTWWEQFNAPFFITIGGIVSALLGVILNSILKSKCSRVRCCGLECVRDVKVEEELELARQTVSSPQTESSRRDQPPQLPDISRL